MYGNARFGGKMDATNKKIGADRVETSPPNRRKE
jgi:hypothetical protein